MKKSESQKDKEIAICNTLIEQRNSHKLIIIKSESFDTIISVNIPRKYIDLLDTEDQRSIKALSKACTDLSSGNTTEGAQKLLNDHGSGELVKFWDDLIETYRTRYNLEPNELETLYI